jgi:FkbM family methyltransferase
MDINERILNFHTSRINCFKTQILAYSKYIDNKDILDIGSNIGLISFAICSNLNYKSIHLFEPNIFYFNYSKELLKDYNNIYFNNVGVGNTNKEELLYCCRNENIGWNTFLKKDPLQNDNFINNMDQQLCKIITLDDYYKNIENIDFIKIDVEGYEAYVIEGAIKLIEKFKPYIYVEIGWGINHPFWNFNVEIYNKLFKLGYKKIEFSNETKDILFEPI